MKRRWQRPCYTINGFGKPFGFPQAAELGVLETPIALTGTLNVPRVADALITLAIEQNPHIGVGFAESGRRGYASVNPLVGETSDGFLSDLQGRPLGETAVRAALDAAEGGPVEEGTVGAGTGVSCFGWKGGIGTASRRLPRRAGGYTVGALVQTNYGRPEELTVAGAPVGQHLRPPGYESIDRRLEIEEGGPSDSGDNSIMIVLATDAPLDARQLGRLCRRAAFGLARTGSTCHGGSGDFVVAFSTAVRIPDRPGRRRWQRPAFHLQGVMGDFALAVIEAVEEAIYNSLLMATTVVGRDGNTRHALPVDELVTVMGRYGR